MGCLYALTSPSGKQYIGITTKTAEQRWAKHVEHALGKRQAGYLYNALRKHGASSFTLQTLVIASDVNYLRALERSAIVAFQTKHPNGYNVASGGELAPGPKSDAARARMSTGQKARHARPEERQRLLEAGARGREIRSKVATSKRVDGLAPWQQRKKASRLKSQVDAETFRAEVSKRIREGMARPEVMEKIKSEAQKRASSLEWRAKVSAAKSVPNGRTRDTQSEEERQRRSDGARRMWERRKAARAAE